MPKAVDIYVLEKRIGSGQFGDVFKGYSKVDGSQVAIKTMRRDKIKGKFTELLENEIQVLKSCRNNNIIRLIDIKKTVNNIYLILEYCNEGDLSACIKQRAEPLPENEAIEYFVQILHAFETLLKNKIMHRDFKLPNVLKHNGVIKIADFGFSKLLDEEDEQVETILGSPLNMAPEVLDHQPYNNKADIWSVGVAFYEMIFSKVPYTASNVIDLLKKIKSEPLSFPRKAHLHVEDVLKKMLVVDPTKRIEWTELFNHPITRMLEEELEESLKKSMLCQDDDLPVTMSRFYIQNNRVISNLNTLFVREDLNSYIKGVLSQEQPKAEQYKGKLIKRQSERQNVNCYEAQTKPQRLDREQNAKEQIVQENEGAKNEQSKDSQNSKLGAIKSNTGSVLFLRNKYCFLGHLAEEALELQRNSKYSDCLAFLLIKQVVERINRAIDQLGSRKLQGVQFWQQFEQSAEYQKLIRFLQSEKEVFNKFYETLSIRVLEKGALSEFEEDMMISGQFTREETNRKMYVNVLEKYLKTVLGKLSQVKDQRAVLIHLIKILEAESIAEENDSKRTSFSFDSYYDQFTYKNEAELAQQMKKLLKLYEQNK